MSGVRVSEFRVLRALRLGDLGVWLWESGV